MKDLRIYLRENSNTIQKLSGKKEHFKDKSFESEEIRRKLPLFFN